MVNKWVITKAMSYFDRQYAAIYLPLAGYKPGKSYPMFLKQFRSFVWARTKDQNNNIYFNTLELGQNNCISLSMFRIEPIKSGKLRYFISQIFLFSLKRKSSRTIVCAYQGFFILMKCKLTICLSVQQMQFRRHSSLLQQ